MTDKRLTGGLQGDFSRFRFDPGRRDSAVRLQQGRVILDSDWNEQSEIQTHRRRTGLVDLIGPAGGPAEHAGFAIRADPLLEFDGQRHFVVIGGEGVDAWRASTGCTVELWFNPAAGHGGVLLGRFSRGGGGEGFSHDYTLLIEADGRLLLHRPAEVGGPLVADSRVAFGHPNHVALRYNQEQTSLLLGGKLVAADSRGLPSTAAGSVAVLGATVRGGQPTQAFAGFLYELRFWTVERSASELSRDGRPGAIEGQPAGLAGLWRFDQDPGTTPADGHIPDRGPHGIAAVLGGGRAENQPRGHLRQLRVEAGRYYVEGMLCRQLAPAPVSQPTPQTVAAGGTWLLYLEAWEHLVTAAQDPRLLEPALGGADTTARSRVTCRVRALPAGADLAPAEGEAVLEHWARFAAMSRRSGRLQARRRADMIGVDIGNVLYRVEVRSAGAGVGSPWTGSGESVARWIELVRKGADCTPPRARFRLDRWPDPAQQDTEAPGSGVPWSPGDAVEIRAESEAGAIGVFAEVVAADQAEKELVLEAGGLERFQGDQGLRLRRLATFVWSRDNASVLFPVERVGSGGLEVQLETAVRGLPLEAGDWVEWVDPDPDLRPGRLHLVVRTDPLTHSVELEPPAPSPLPAVADGEIRSVLRRWDQRALEHAPLVGGAVVVSGDWQPLEAGVEARFLCDGPHRPCDYWWLPARTALSDIEWPQEEDGPQAREPDGVERRLALLAALAGGQDGGVEVVDYRRTFQPMVDGAVSKAGDTMYGPLRIESDLEVSGEISGRRLFGDLGSPGAVAEWNLRDEAVSARTLAPDVGVVPAGASILGDSPEPPDGYRWTGAVQLLYHQHVSWCRLPPLPRNDARSQAAAAAGKVWLVYESGEAWSYDPVERCWQTAPGVPPRRHFALAGLEDRLYLVGGETRGRATDHCQIFDPAVGSWEVCAPLRQRRSHLAMAALGGELFAVGGLEGRRAVGRTEAFDPILDRWRAGRPMPTPRYDLTAATAGGRVFALGGAHKPWLHRFGCRLTSAVEAYHPASDRWLDHLAMMSSPRSQLGAAGTEERLYAAGGRSTAGTLDLVDEYDPAADHWRHRHTLPGVAPCPAATMLDGWLYVLGVDENGTQEGVYAAKVASTFYVHRRVEVAEPLREASDDGLP